MHSTMNRRTFLTLIGSSGLALTFPAASVVRQTSINDLLPIYFRSTRDNIVYRNGERAILSSRIYPKGTFVRDAFYGPLALNDVDLSRDCYRWFERTQLPHGQIMTAVGFTPDDQADLTPMDDDSSLLFLIWSAWLQQRGVSINPQVVERTFQHVQAHVNSAGDFVSPPGPFRYWADTVNPERSERITHNQGLYMLALYAMHLMNACGIGSSHVAAAEQRYAATYNTSLRAYAFGRDSWWALKQDISSVFPEFLYRWMFGRRALPDTRVVSSVERMVRNASVYKDGKIAGIKVICDSNGAFLPPERYHVPGLNARGRYQNGGYWPMYTLIALSLAYKIEPTQIKYKQIVETLIRAELEGDPISKEIIVLADGQVGTFDPKRSGYTWNALIAPAVKWSGIA